MSKKFAVGTVSEYTLEGLMPDTLYDISIRAYQDILGPASETILVMTNTSEGTQIIQPSSFANFLLMLLIRYFTKVIILTVAFQYLYC